MLAGRTRRALDSAVLLDAVATQDTITQLVAAIRLVPGVAAIVAERCHAHDYTDPGKPKIAWDDEQAKAALVGALVADALTLLDQLTGQDSDELDEGAAGAVGLPALIVGQDVEPADDSDGTDGRRRIARRTAPDRIISTVAPEARHIHKSRQQRQDGYKAHLSVEPETGLFTAVDLRPGAGASHHEAAVAPDLLAGEYGPLQILADGAYAAGRPDRRRTPAADQATRAQTRRPRRVHPGRLQHRHQHRHGHPSRRAHRPTRRPGRPLPAAPRNLHRLMRRLSPSRSLHHRRDQPHPHHPPSP
ncbi:hypothetical protein GCM10009556_075110 [Acrocarpospora pleiomorpha]